jgi:stage V sporulation protein D (sporulation-specific penicillin-binding protein)
LVILKREPHIKKVTRIKRLLLIFVIFGAAFFGIVGRLFYVMYVNGNFYKAGELAESIIDVEITPKRGSILDRKGTALAVSMDAYRVDIDMNTLRLSLNSAGMSMDELTQKLSSILNMSSSDITKILYMKYEGNPVKYANLIRQIDKGQADKINALKIQGLIVSGDSKRDYTNDNFLASTLGYVNDEGNGVAGVEESYNSVLLGTPGREVFQKDNKGNELPYEQSEYTPAINGKNVELTIDSTIQLYAEQAAETALKANKAKSVTITVMNPKNGEILAMVSKPDYNPNSPGTNISGTSTPVQDLWQNNAVQHSFEPGSIFKVITSYAAMAEKVVNDATRFYDPGYIIVDNDLIHEWKPSGFPPQTFQDIIKNSSNVGFVNVGINLLGKEKLFKYINLFNFGQKTGIDLPGESNGIVNSINKTNKVELADMSFGQGISVTAVQYLAAFNAVANGGTWIRPHVMKEIVHNDSNNNPIVDEKYSNYGEKTILDKNTTATLRGYLRNVVAPDQGGVGVEADVPGLDIAGKTGTAQKADPKTGRYATGKYMASFAGMAPYTDPKITLLVSVDEPDPSNYYGGKVAAPVAHDLFQEIFTYLQSNGDAPLK